MTIGPTVDRYADLGVGQKLGHKRVAPTNADLASANEMHEILFPLDRRQVSALAKIAPQEATRPALAALQAGVFEALGLACQRMGASVSIVSWIRLEDDPVAGGFLSQLGGPAVPRNMAREAIGKAIDDGVSVGDAYCSLFPADSRHRLGEHYTPRSVVRRIVETVREADVAADPACGDARFLVELIRRGHDPAALWGGDLNPLAVAFARWEVWKASGSPSRVPEVAVAWIDFLLGGRQYALQPWAPSAPPGAQPATHFVGNPPWILWRNLGSTYRSAIAGVYAHTRLNQAKGWSARVSAGQTDVAYLFLHEAAERVGLGGRVSFVMPRSLLKSPVGASVVRTGRTTNGRPFSFRRVLDYATADVFPDVRTDTIVAFVESDVAQCFPVPWESIEDPRRQGAEAPAWPSDVDNPSSPWTNGHDTPPLRLLGGQKRATLVARGGVNTGGGNGIFHVSLLDATDGLATIRNRPSARFPVKELEAVVERRYLRPLLHGRDVALWRASPSGWILLPHREDDPRKPIPEATLEADAPRTLAYLRHFRHELEGRKELSRWGGLWYSLFRIGFYTTSGWRVVWPSSGGQRVRAAVLPAGDPTVPDQKVILVTFESPEPAYFLCSLINSSRLRSAIASAAGLDASPNLVNRLLLPAWDPQDPIHQRLASLGEAAAAGSISDEQVLDELVDKIYQV